MYLLVTSTLLILMSSIDALASAVYRCKDSESGATVYADRPCINIPSQKLHLKPPNIVKGVTAHELRLLNKLVQRTSNRVERNNSGRSHRAIEHQEKHCIRTQLKIDRLNLKLKRGYKSKKYNEYRNKLREYKKYRNQYCS